MASAHFQSRNGYIHYDKRGLGPPVVLLHGLYVGASHEEYRHNIAALQRYFTVYAVDLLGYGDSDSPHLTHTAELHQHLLRAFITEEIGSRAHIIASGASCGIAVRLGVYDEQVVDRQVLICPDQKDAYREPPAFSDRVSQFILGTLSAGVGVYETAASPPSLAAFLRDRYHDMRQATEERINHLHNESRRPGSMFPYISRLNGYFDVDALRWLRYVRAMTQVIWGADLGEAPIERIHQPAAWSRGKELRVIENARHWPHDERSAEVNQMMIEFLTRPGAGQGDK